MKNSEILLKKIDEMYDNRENVFEKHKKLLSFFQDFWIDINERSPSNKEEVFCKKDYTQIGRGQFIDNLYYYDGEFVVNIGDSDPYGHITHWFSYNSIDEANINFEDLGF